MTISAAAVTSERVKFTGSQGEQLAGRLDRLVASKPRAYAIFAHCFTCSKDVFAANRISKGLAQAGFAVLRFDFTGLGQSGGDFANSNFSGNVQDLVAAAQFMASEHEAPSLLVGHSLGGAAVLAAAHDLPSVKAVATIGAPSDPEHVIHNFKCALDEISADGEAKVELAGRPFTIKKQFLDDLAEQHQQQKIAKLKRALLILHSPVDATVGVENAADIFTTAKHPKSFVSLDRADHLLTDPADAVFAADTIAAWARRYVPFAEEPTVSGEGEVQVSETGNGKFQQLINTGEVHLHADEPKSYGGDATGPTPYDLLLAGLGACTGMTIRLYADRKKWPLEHVQVDLSHAKVHALDSDGAEKPGAKVDEISRTVHLTGDLTDDQRAKLLEIADKCPVHKTLHSEVIIKTALSEAG